MVFLLQLVKPNTNLFLNQLELDEEYLLEPKSNFYKYSEYLWRWA